MPIRVLVVDDHPVVRHGLKMYLEVDPELEFAGEAADGKEAVRLAQELKPDVVLMDLMLPKLNGVAATTAIRQALPDTEVIALTSVLDDENVFAAIRAGAIGYLLKNAHREALAEAIKRAAEGQVQLSPEAAARLVREVRAPDSPEVLTERETEVLRMLALGKANKTIAREMKVREVTVKSHVSSILAKLGMQSRTQAALHAVRIGLVSDRELARS